MDQVDAIDIIEEEPTRLVTQGEAYSEIISVINALDRVADDLPGKWP